ncbi:MAG: 30S ribosomal protein S13, partial [Candidatus Omnitrophica bacterium]|nr:30S ribosomal protein S13 [Candidatus Omnitrophota bacterium]
MPRILGVDIPKEKRIEASLRYIYGIGPTRSREILAQANIDCNRRAKELSDEEIS